MKTTRIYAGVNFVSWSVLALALVLASTGVQKYGNAISGSVWYVVRSKFCVWSATGRLGECGVRSYSYEWALVLGV